jgi:predicted kinase
MCPGGRRSVVSKEPLPGTPSPTRMPDPFLVLVTGFAAAGKTTLAPLLAERLGALWISRDSIHEMVYSGWEPQHPALTAERYDPQIGASTFFEGAVVWRIFLWMLARVTPRVPVVADTPFNHEWNRTMFAEAAAKMDVPMVEVALGGDPDVLLERARARARGAGVHELKARFSVRPERYQAGEYQPVLEAEHVIRVDTTDLGAVDVNELARRVGARLSGHR